MNSLLEENINKELILEKKFEDSYVYKLISQLSNSKIFFEDFIEKFQNYKKASLQKKDMIEKIFVKQIDNQIFLSSP